LLSRQWLVILSNLLNKIPININSLFFIIRNAKNLPRNLLTIHWSVIDPAGKSKNFNAEAFVTQNNADCLDHLTCIGKTNDTTSDIPPNGLFIQ
jgi:hypothetical protein